MDDPAEWLLVDALHALPGCVISMNVDERLLRVYAAQRMAACIEWPAGSRLNDKATRASIVRQAVTASARVRADAALLRAVRRGRHAARP